MLHNFVRLSVFFKYVMDWSREKSVIVIFLTNVALLSVNNLLVVNYIPVLH